MIVGNCSCGSVKLLLSLPDEIHNYIPRACDCDFCMERQITYLSDPEGKLTIHSKNKLVSVRQGSEQAIFLTCNQCNDVVSVVCKFGTVYKGAINATLLKDFEQMKESQVVSPKYLSAKEKLKRWSSLWLSVDLDYESNT